MSGLAAEIREAGARIAAGGRGVLVEVARAAGSAPREAGARMLVFADSSVGTIGGGALEYAALGRARAALAGRAPAPARETLPLGPSLGQCCGGSVTLRYTEIAGPGAGPGAAALEEWRAALEAERLPLLLFGAGHVGRALARALEPLPFDTTWIDSRPGAFPEEEHGAVRRASPAPHVEAAAAPPGALLLVMTHSHAQDFAIVDAAIRRADLAFVGLIGSATKRARFLSRLRGLGHGEAALERLVCPIGLPGLSGKAPEIVAASAAAQALSVREAALRERGRA